MLAGRHIGLGDGLTQDQSKRLWITQGASTKPWMNLAAVTQGYTVAPPVVPTGDGSPRATFNPALVTPPISSTKLLLYAGGGLVALYLVSKLLGGSSTAAPSLPVHKNPRRRNPERVPIVTTTARLARAVDKYESFHWGDEPTKIVRKKVSKTPRVGVKLGKLVSVAYETRKNGEHAVWEHEFGEEGGKRPDLVEDADTGRLHIVGGSYKVRPEGIID